MMKRFLIAAIVLVAAVNLTYADGTDGRLPLPNDVFYYAPAAAVYGPEAAWTNPAGLGRFQAAGFQLMADYYAGNYAKSWGSVVFRDRIVTGYRHIYNESGEDYDEWLAAGGMALGQTVRLGFSYRYFRNGPGAFNNRHFWTLGTILAGRGNLKVAGVLSNLNRGRVDGERTAVEHRYSLAYRGLTHKLILSADMFLSSRNSVRDADFAYHAEYTPIPGLSFTGYVDNDRNFQIGVRANLYRYFTGSKTSVNRHGHDGRTTVYFGATNERQPSLLPEPKRRLDLSFGGGFAENPPQPVFGHRGTPFVSVLMNIYRAADDPSIAEMTLEIGNLVTGFGKAQEFREALKYFRSKGKRITCHLTTPNNIGIYLASVADTVLIPPVSQVNMIGLRAELTFWAGTLEKLGVKIEMLRIGDYKSGTEPYTRTSASEEYREQMNSLMDQLYAQFVADIAQGRGLTEDSIKALIDSGPMTSVEALEAGLVDGLTYGDQTKDWYGTWMPEICYWSYAADTVITGDWPGPPSVAVVVAEGEISANGGADHPLGIAGGVTPSSMAQAFGVAGANPDVKAIVFRIDSPGGSALAGEAIHRSAEGAAKSKPLFVSMANVAASGGYYIAMPGRRVFVDPLTITGSIGIYGGKADFSGLYEKLDVGKELITRGRYAGMLTNMRPFTEEERRKYMDHLQAFYDHFVNLVADSRGLTKDSVDNLGQGKVWTGQEAVANGLADEIGGLKEALDYAAKSVGLDDYRVEVYPQRRPWFLLPGDNMFRRLLSVFGVGHAESSLEQAVPFLSDDEVLLTRLPYDITIE